MNPTVRALSRLGVICLAFAGCGGGVDSTIPVHGVIKWSDGSAATQLAEATVEFQPSGEGQQRVSPTGEVKSDGSFDMKTATSDDGVPAGKYRVIIMPKQIVDDERRSSPSILSAQFQSYQTTPLEVEVEAGAEDVELIVGR